MIENALPAVIEAEFARLREQVRRRIDEASTTSEQATLATGELLTKILGEARAQVSDLADLGSRISGENNRESADQIAAQTTVEMRSFVDLITRQLAEQVSALERGSEAMKAILKVGHRIGDISTASRLLALNAIVEASRLGDAGAASRVIAQELKSLAQSVEAANGEVNELARQLSSSLPAVAATTSSLNVEVASFRTRFESKLRSLDEAFAELRGAATTSANRSRGHLDAIVNSCHEALSRLQFQDPMVQGLRKVVGVVDDACVTIQKVAAGVDGASPSPAQDTAPGGPAGAISHDDSMDGGTLALF